jgi:radical SAM protein with 4Fe4S-binding SPASM domain
MSRPERGPVAAALAAGVVSAAAAAGVASAAAVWPRATPRWARLARRHRFERFGAIFQLTRPRALVFTDRQYARDALRLREEPVQWDSPGDGVIGSAPLSAPFEAHLQLTNRCAAGCKGCYTGASPEGAPGEWGLVEWKRALDELARCGVFHVALGGGESAALPWLGELAEHASSLGIIPNLTTSGLEGLERLLEIHDRFGQINVSLDGIGAVYQAVRGFDGFAAADRAIAALRAVKREVGINVVVTRANFDALDEIFAYARQRQLNEVELLRYKPAGRGSRGYQAQRCSDAQHRAFFPLIQRAARRHRVRIKVDCSYTPMVAHHQPDPALLAQLVVYGCTGGDFLIGAKASGQLTACSFAAPPPALEGHRPQVDELAAYWQQPGAFGPFRGWRQAAEPCRSCSYLELCRGGCRVVSSHAGDAAAPDPECPRVIDARAATLPVAGVGAGRLDEAVTGEGDRGAPAAKPRRHLPVL